jgi:hypothetical protein
VKVPPLKNWVVTLDVDYIQKTFVVKHITDMDNGDYVSRLFVPYVTVSAVDELGAFSRAVEALTNLGINSARKA